MAIHVSITAKHAKNEIIIIIIIIIQLSSHAGAA